jgi:hypothetical protein
MCHGAAPTIHEYARHRADESHGKQEEDGYQRDIPSRSVHAERHRAQDCVEREKISKDADQLSQPKFAKGGNGQGLSHVEPRITRSCHTQKYTYT